MSTRNQEPVAPVSAPVQPPVCTPLARRRRLPEPAVVLGVGVVAALVFTIPARLFPHFYYLRANSESFVPLWHHLGTRLRSGQWPAMDPAGWYGGNYAAESEYSLWNPLQVANYVLVSYFDDLSVAATVVTVEFLVLLSMAVYLLARTYNARRTFAVVVAVAMPACGFTLYYSATSSAVELLALALVAWFWWAALRFARGETTPLLPFCFGALAATTGNPYALAGLAVVLLGIGADLFAGRRFRRLGHLLLLGVCAVVVAAVMYLPMLAAMRVAAPADSGDVAGVARLGDIAGSSAPSYLPSIGDAGGELPSAYLTWFLVPLLPWLRWRALRVSIRSLASAVVIVVVLIAAALWPSGVWLFHQPARLIEYAYLGVAVLVAWALSAGLARSEIGRRSAMSAALIAAGAYLSLITAPRLGVIHVLATIIAAELVAGAVAAYRRRGSRAFGGMLLVGTVVVLVFQVMWLPARPPGTAPPTSVSLVRQQSVLAEGTVLQLAQPEAGDGILAGNQNLLRGHETINHYSRIGHAKFNNALCIDQTGAVCADALRRLWLPVAGTEIPLADALRVRTLIVQRSLFPDEAGDPPAGWHLVSDDEVRTIWIRDEHTLPGRVTWASPGVVVDSADVRPDGETVAVDAPDEGGRLVFARLNWPGYAVTIDNGGVAAPDETDEGLVAVDVPPGRHTLRLSFTEPGLHLGALLAGAAALAAVTQAWCLRRRRNPS